MKVSQLFLITSTIVFIFLTINCTYRRERHVHQSIESVSVDYDKYSFDSLRKTNFVDNSITIGESIRNNETCTSFYAKFINGNQYTSALINLPKAEGIYPIAVLFRGYVDKTIFRTGMGSERIGEFLCSNGFITISPDFLGYGKSSKASEDSLIERFEAYTTALSVIDSIARLNDSIIASNTNHNILANTTNISLWGHSNGGHLALAVLAITGNAYPTVLWAPVSKPFPYSILYFTDEYSDNGKYLRKIISDFEEQQDIERFNPSNYYEWINAPIQIHQGKMDDAVPTDWSEELYAKLKALDISTELYLYDEGDHNLMPLGWSDAALRTLEFMQINRNE